MTNMSQLKQIFSSLVLAAAIASLPGLAVVAQTDSVSPANPGSGPSNLIDAAPSVDELVTLFKRGNPNTTRAANFCPLSPGLLGETDVIWSDRPLFLWQGSATEITLRELDAPDDRVWSQTLTPTDQGVVYTGAPLEPGKLYVWEVSTEAGISEKHIFQVMDLEARDRINAELQELERQLQLAGITGEAAALERSEYFANQDLWSDALQSLYSVSSPSASLIEGIEEITIHLCQRPTVSTTP